MNKKRMMFAALFLSLLLATLAMQGCVPAPNCSVSEYVTTRFDDTNDWVCDAADCSLREAVLNANACSGPQTIRLAAGDYYLSISGPGEDAAVTGDLDITDDLTILGMGILPPDRTKIDVYWDRVFDVFSPATVVFQDMVVHSGSEADGGGLRNESDLTLSNVFFLENVASNKGGGIYNTGNLALQDVRFYENEAGLGAGIANDGTGVIEAIGLELEEGRGPDGLGGGLWNGSSAEATLEEFQVWRHFDASAGGGIYNDGTLELCNGVIERNYVNSRGGGLYTGAGASSILYDVRITNNHGHYGGGVYNLGMTHLYQSDVTNNRSDNGALFNYVASPGIRLQNVTVSGNETSDPNGAGGIANLGGDVQLEFVTLAENEGIGLQLVGGGHVTMNSTILADNQTANCSGVSSPSIGLGFNLDDDGTCNLNASEDLSGLDPLLSPLSFNGVTTMTHALIKGSPAIDSGELDMCIAVDQRGVSRPVGPRCDRGAYEGYVLVPLTLPTVIPPDLVTITPTPTPAPTPTPTPSACFYTAALNANCRASDYPESSLISILMEGETAELIALNPEYTHGKFETEAGKPCWMWLGLLDGPVNPLHDCDVPVIDPPPSPESICSEDMGQEECEASGGTWGAVRVGAAPRCVCP
jgi:predicted outer membrane repeat protein